MGGTDVVKPNISKSIMVEMGDNSSVTSSPQIVKGSGGGDWSFKVNPKLGGQIPK